MAEYLLFSQCHVFWLAICINANIFCNLGITRKQNIAFTGTGFLMIVPNIFQTIIICSITLMILYLLYTNINTFISPSVIFSRYTCLNFQIFSFSMVRNGSVVLLKCIYLHRTVNYVSETTCIKIKKNKKKDPASSHKDQLQI